jgi:hypothetical protein
MPRIRGDALHRPKNHEATDARTIKQKRRGMPRRFAIRKSGNPTYINPMSITLGNGASATAPTTVATIGRLCE